MEDYLRPQIARTAAAAGAGWTLNFAARPFDGRAEFRTLLLAEYPPTRRNVAKPSARVIAGRKVNLTVPGGRSPVHSAQWQTRRAVYAVVALPRKRSAGRTAREAAVPRTITRLIECLP